MEMGTPDPPLDPCAQLILEIQRGDESAFNDLYHRSGDTLLLLLLKRSPNKHAAKQALNDIFTHIWTRASSFDPSQETGRAWLCGLVAQHGAELR